MRELACGWSRGLFNAQWCWWGDQLVIHLQALRSLQCLGHSVISQSKNLKVSTTLLGTWGRQREELRRANLHFLINIFYFLEQFIGLQKKWAESSENSLIHPLSSSVSHWYNTLVIIDDPELLHYHIPKSIVYIRVHWLCCTYYRVCLTHNIVNLPLQYHTK